MIIENEMNEIVLLAAIPAVIVVVAKGCRV